MGDFSDSVYRQCQMEQYSATDKQPVIFDGVICVQQDVEHQGYTDADKHNINKEQPCGLTAQEQTACKGSR